MRGGGVRCREGIGPRRNLRSFRRIPKMAVALAKPYAFRASGVGDALASRSFSRGGKACHFSIPDRVVARSCAAGGWASPQPSWWALSPTRPASRRRRSNGSAAHRRPGTPGPTGPAGQRRQTASPRSRSRSSTRTRPISPQQARRSTFMGWQLGREPHPR